MNELGEDLVLEGEELRAEGPIIEEGAGRVHVPKKGSIFEEDGSVQVAVIRPCISRGKRIRGLAPIYEADMLGKNARVFEGWHMWMGHLTEGLAEAVDGLQEKLEEAAANRNIARDLGGRVTETWFDPSYVGSDDDSMGYRPGAIMAKVIPYPAAKAILECDPQGLHVSIAAWPTSARKAKTSWDGNQIGMAIEGFRATPRGSVDWVLRGGAGGRLDERTLKEAEAVAVSALEGYYSPPRVTDPDPSEETMAEIDFTNMTQEQLLENLKESNPDLHKKLTAQVAGQVETRLLEANPGLSEEKVAEIVSKAVSEAVEETETRLTAKIEEAESGTSELLEEREGYKLLEKAAEKQIKAAGLKPKATQDLLNRYRVLPSGPTNALLVEATDEASAEEVLREKIEADITYVQELLEEASSGPQVRGLGGTARSTTSASGGKKTNEFRQFLKESASPDAEDLKDEDLKTLVQEGIS